MNFLKQLIVSSSQQENAFDSIEVTVFRIYKEPVSEKHPENALDLINFILFRREIDDRIRIFRMCLIG